MEPLTLALWIVVATLAVLATGIPEVHMISESLDGVYVASTTEEFQKNLETALQLSESHRVHLREWSQNQSWKKVSYITSMNFLMLIIKLMLKINF